MANSRKSGTVSSSQGQANNAAALARIASEKSVKAISEALGSDTMLYLVGGTVRDSLQGIVTGDLDLACAMSPQDMLSRLEARGLRVIATGLKHGTITCAFDGQNIEITTFRAGRGRSSGLIEEDLSGRDFTINAIAFSVTAQKIIDPFDGIADLAEGFLRFVGSAEDRIREDPLRMLRFVRFGEAAGRRVDLPGAEQVKVLSGLLAGVSVERIRVEIEKILMSADAAAGLRAVHAYGLMPHCLPELIPTIGFEQNDFHTMDVFEHTLDVISKCPKDKILRFAALYHDIGKAHTLSIGADGKRHFYDHEKVSTEIADSSMHRLRFSNDDIESVKTIVRLHMRPFDCGPAGVRRILRDSGALYPLWREFKNADRPAVFDDALLQELKDRFDGMVETERNRKTGSVFGALAITGDDLIALGMTPGRELGAVLKEIQSLVLDNPDLNERSLLIEKAKEICSKTTR